MKTIIILSVILFTTQVVAINLPKAYPSDPNIAWVNFQAHNIVPIFVPMLQQVTLNFSHNETVIQANNGDQKVWHINKPSSLLQNHLVIKPTSLESNTHLTVFTNQHVYYFQLITDPKHSLYPYYAAIDFLYPNDEKNQQAALAKVQKALAHDKYVDDHPNCKNYRYSFSGSHTLFPQKVCDDGTFTYFEFHDHQSIPAIFPILDHQGQERSLVTRRVGSYVVVKTIAQEFSLRLGHSEAAVMNHGWQGW
ncbi:MAG: TrbG/VirB9 family P-type conjugative transfer protein [Legionellales bacterium]|nr:TrbG/VirB9 family P-type conjugative transfer protein [Legionellales bacterium]